MVCGATVVGNVRVGLSMHLGRMLDLTTVLCVDQITALGIVTWRPCYSDAIKRR